MASIDKKILELQSKPKGFRWDDTEAIMIHFGYRLLEGNGSRVKFYHPEKDSVLSLHKPHNPKTLRPYQVIDILKKLREDGFL